MSAAKRGPLAAVRGALLTAAAGALLLFPLVVPRVDAFEKTVAWRWANLGWCAAGLFAAGLLWRGRGLVGEVRGRVSRIPPAPPLPKGGDSDAPPSARGGGLDAPASFRGGGLDAPASFRGGGLDVPASSTCGLPDPSASFRGGGLDVPASFRGGALAAPASSKGGVLAVPAASSGGALDAPAAFRGGALDVPASSKGGVLAVPAASSGGALDAPASFRGGALDAPASSTCGLPDPPASSIGGILDVPASSSGGTLDVPASTKGGVLDVPASFRGGVVDAAHSFKGSDADVPPGRARTRVPPSGKGGQGGFEARARAHRLAWAAGTLLALALPAAGSTYQVSVLTSALIAVILGLGLNIIVGLAGLLNLGYAAFYAVGAYAYALLNLHFGVGFWAALPLAGLIAAGCGVALGFPVLRLRGDYLAIVTLGFGEIVRLVLENWSAFSGGPGGVANIPRVALPGWEPGLRGATVLLYYVSLALAALAALVVARLRDSRMGRAWLALREDELAAEAMGIGRTRVKLAALAAGAFWAGVAGVLFAARTTFVSPASFTFLESALALAAVVLGGPGSVGGVAVAALVLVLLPEYLRPLAQYRMLVFGAALAAMMILRARRPAGWATARAAPARAGR